MRYSDTPKASSRPNWNAQRTSRRMGQASSLKISILRRIILHNETGPVCGIPRSSFLNVGVRKSLDHQERWNGPSVPRGPPRGPSRSDMTPSECEASPKAIHRLMSFP